MLFKNSCLASIVAISGLLTAPNTVQAKDIESYQDYQDYCSPAAYQYGIQSRDCDRYRSIYEQRYLQQTNPQQLQRRNAESENKEKNNEEGVSGYVGTTLGLFFPDEESVNTGFGGNLYVGAKFNRYFATDVEIALLGGGTELSDISYGVFAVFINPRFIIPFTDDNNSVSLFLSPGIGISQASIGNSDVIFLDDYRFTWQAKAGVSVPVSKRLSILGQVRYASQFEEDTVDFFGTEIGIDFQF